jgi:hypothetical protein
MAAKNPLIPCVHCERDRYPNELQESKLHGGLVCRDCQADQDPPPPKGVEARTGSASNAWLKNGSGWCV